VGVCFAASQSENAKKRKKKKNVWRKRLLFPFLTFVPVVLCLEQGTGFIFFFFSGLIVAVLVTHTNCKLHPSRENQKGLLFPEERTGFHSGSQQLQFDLKRFENIS
jgi:hypothetical protein